MTRPPSPRIAPLPFEQWDEELRARQGAYLRDGTGEPLNVFATLANHPNLMRRWLVFATHVLSKSTLPARERELLILRTGYLCSSEYEWGQHVLIARRCGITDAEIDAVMVGASAPGWSAQDAALLQAADELHHSSKVQDQTWGTLASRLSTEQLMDVVFTVGNYHVVAMALNSFGVQRDEGVPGLPAPR